MITRLLSYLFCLYLIVSTPYAYAIDPITGAWTANAAASAAFGGGVSGGAAAVQAAVTSAAGAAATAATAAAAAAAVAGAGVAAFCVTSFALGDNLCGDGPSAGLFPFKPAFAGAGITVDPDSGHLLVSGKSYYLNLVYVNQTGYGCYRTSIAATKNCYREMLMASRGLESVNFVTTSTADCSAAPAAPDFIRCETVDVQYVAPNTGGAVQTFQNRVDFVVSAGSKTAEDEQIGDAIGKNPAARAAAAAALAQPSYAAAKAAAASATRPALGAAAECQAKGMKSGTFNGTVFCVGTAAGTDGTGADAGQTGTDAGAGTGTGTGTGNPPATGGGAAPLPAFCVYAQTLCEWILWTKQNPDPVTDTEVEIEEPEETISPAEYQKRYLQFSNVCPSPESIPINFMGASQTIELSYNPLCEMADKMRPVIILVAWIVGARIVVGSPAKGES